VEEEEEEEELIEEVEKNKIYDSRNEIVFVLV
jgi:hypothetical protein